MEMYNIFYFYGDDIEMEVEDWIMDEIGLNKVKMKVVVKYGKFCIKIIDLFDDLMEQVMKMLGGVKLEVFLLVKEFKVILEVFDWEFLKVVEQGVMVGYKYIFVDKILGNIIKMFFEDWMLIIVGMEDKYNMMIVSWGGLGYFYNKLVLFCFIYFICYIY